MANLDNVLLPGFLGLPIALGDGGQVQDPDDSLGTLLMVSI